MTDFASGLFSLMFQSALAAAQRTKGVLSFSSACRIGTAVLSLSGALKFSKASATACRIFQSLLDSSSVSVGTTSGPIRPNTWAASCRTSASLSVISSARTPMPNLFSCSFELIRHRAAPAAQRTNPFLSFNNSRRAGMAVFAWGPPKSLAAHRRTSASLSVSNPIMVSNAAAASGPLGLIARRH